MFSTSFLKKSVFPLLVSIFFIFSCQKTSFDEPLIPLDDYKIVDGFSLQVVASEPLLDAPVTMDFDNQGRMWVVEMIGYMPNIEGIGEEEPLGRIAILEDLDQDGIADHSKVFLDNLVLPRAIAHLYGGLLYVEPPNLWFVEIDNDMPGKRTLVDSVYADAGNVEHQPNGLMMNLDNWIYNANSNFRYQRKNGKWIKEPTSYRGQWGITKDDFGRLYYNSNSNQIKGDFVLPNKVIRNQYLKPSENVNRTLNKNQRVYPLHPTSINRGYIEGNLDQDSMVVNTTAACGPLVYRGGQFPDEYNLNAFVCIPEANIIKRNILAFEGVKVAATQAWEGKEFIASTDEGFRPVNLFNGPDGAMYILDMHRGIIQHKAFISQYLTQHLADKQLDTIKTMGRVLKVTSNDKPLNAIPDFENASGAELVELLHSTNGWIRDRAQQLLITNSDNSIQEQLINLIRETKSFKTQIHALYTLDGLNLLSFELLNEVILTKTNHPKTIVHSLSLLENFVEKISVNSMKQLTTMLLKRNDQLIDFYLCTTLNPWIKLAKKEFLPYIEQLSMRYTDEPNYQEAIASSLSGLEESYLETYGKPKLLKETLAGIIQNKKDSVINPIYINVSVKEDARTNGLKLFRSICAACHGPSGDGITELAPPLRESEYVTGSIKRLASIVLHGLQGPVHVNGKLYELNGTMPGLANNKSLSDQDIVDIIRFLQNAYVHDKKSISTKEIKALRSKPPKNGKPYTEKELLEMNFEN
ncbi:PVC-type heme-binding CxxCH protein [Reichenbachiella sp. MALMAid0571]|uniref:PVC-type heme-binding CxxCH protein n=1 Tax=Reichenbachiella sp. MALMAid0571 TaxID=3143939 RepID=UPI0032DE6ECF